MSAHSYQDQLQAQPQQAESKQGFSAAALIGICLAVLAIGFTIGSTVTRHQYDGVIAEYQSTLDEAASALRHANDMLQMQPSLPAPMPSVPRTNPTPPAPMLAKKNPAEDPAADGNAGNAGGMNQDPGSVTTPMPAPEYYAPPPTAPATGSVPAPGRG